MEPARDLSATSPDFEISTAGKRLNERLSASGLGPLSNDATAKFATYLSLILRWNARTNLTAVRDPEGILSRHFIECIACAYALPPEIHALLDFGSGAGFPGLPITICRPEIAVVLSESQGKKAAFLREAVRALGIGAEVHGGRAEEISRKFDCVTLRAVDKMEEAVATARELIAPGGLLALMTTSGDLERYWQAAGEEFLQPRLAQLPGSESRILALGRKKR
jgi:16S rRNA (guanine527-N7)-methyltransferase